MHGKIAVIRTTMGDESLSGVKRTGIFVLLVTVRKLYPSGGSTKIILTTVNEIRKLNSDLFCI